MNVTTFGDLADMASRHLGTAAALADSGLPGEGVATAARPIRRIALTLSRYLGDISGDLNGRRGRIMGMDQHGDNQVIRAQVPLSEVQTYSTDLRSMTSGEGSFTMTFSRLDVVPHAVAQRHIDKFEKSRHPDED